MFIGQSLAAFVSETQTNLLLDLPSGRSFVTNVFVTFGGSSLLDKGMLRDRLALDSRRTAATISS